MVPSSRIRTIAFLSLTAVAIGFISCGGSGTDGSTQLGVGQVLELSSNPEYERSPDNDPLHHAFTFFATGTGTDTMPVLFNNSSSHIPLSGENNGKGDPMTVIFRRKGTTANLQISATISTNVITLPGPIQSYGIVQMSLRSIMTFDAAEDTYNKPINGSVKYRLTLQGNEISAHPGTFDTGETLLDGGEVTIYPSADYASIK